MRLVLAALLLVACKHDAEKPPSPAPVEKHDAQPAPPDPYVDVRDQMVTDTIERRGVRDQHVLDAMRQVPRHEFVPPSVRARAYEDAPQQIGFDQTISQPYIVAVMTEAARITPGAKVLEIGTGSGYQAAVLAAMGADVYTMEIDDNLAKRTRAVFATLGLDKIHFEVGDGYFGWPKAAPFDAIIVTAAPPSVPEPLIKQLKPGGRLVAPIGAVDQFLVVMTKDQEGMRSDELMEVRFHPMIGEAQRHP